MIKCKEISDYLFKIYGNTILCRVGKNSIDNGRVVYNASNENYAEANMAVYLHEELRIAVVWDLKNRRLKNLEIKAFSLSTKRNDIYPQSGEIKAIYKKMGTRKDSPYEKVLVLDVDTLVRIAEELPLFLMINPNDNGFPNDLSCEGLEIYDYPESIRKRVSTKRWERDRKFRQNVLAIYGYRCAICRCNEEKLLEAAHIIAVANDGNDNIENGICLCANHHTMFDWDLIRIDFKKHCLTFVSEKAMAMPWYSVFNEKYEGKLLLPDYSKTQDDNPSVI